MKCEEQVHKCKNKGSKNGQIKFCVLSTKVSGKRVVSIKRVVAYMITLTSPDD